MRRLLVAALVACSLALAACPATVTGNAALVTGIFITPDELLDNNLACGEDGGDAYKFIAVAINASRDIVGAAIFDCYAEGVFGNLPGTDAGALNYGVWVFGYTYEQWNESNANDTLVNAVAAVNSVNQPDGSTVAVPVSVVSDGGTIARPPYGGALSTICLRQATWVAACSATSQASIQSLAYCRPLALEKEMPSSCYLPILLPEGGLDASAPDATLQN